MSAYQHIVVSQDDALATVTINREHRLNSISIDTTAELIDAFRSLAATESLRAVVVTGAGSRAFCAGADTADMTPRSYAEYEGLVRYYFDLLRALRSIPVPVIARINGDAAGGGCCLAMACDLRVAVDTARLGVPFVRIGLSGADLAASYLLPRLVGWGRASELLLTGRMVDAREAQSIGLVNEAVATEDLDAAVDRWVQWFRNGPSRCASPSRLSSGTWIGTSKRPSTSRPTRRPSACKPRTFSKARPHSGKSVLPALPDGSRGGVRRRAGHRTQER